MNDTPLQLALRELQTIYTSQRFWVGMAAVILILTIAGPFGTLDQLSFGERLFYWVVISITTFGVGIAVSIIVGKTLSDLKLPDWPSRIAGGMAAGIPIACMVWLINQYGFGFDMGGWSVFIQICMYCIGISTAVVILYFIVNNADEQEPATSPFLERLPVHLGSNLLHISSQDHYVKAVTNKGSELILMRFSDAMKELADAEGLQIHRAHWVALSAVKKPIRKDGKLIIETVDGERLPVSRSHTKTVRQALNIT